MNVRNLMLLQYNYILTYSSQNIYLLTAFFQALFQGHILAINNPDAAMGLSPLVTPLLSAGQENAQQRATRVQVLLNMIQDWL